MSTFKLVVNDSETGEYITTHILDGEDLDEIGLFLDRDTVGTLEEIDLEDWNW